MSKGVNIDLVPLLNWVTAQSAFKEDKKPQRTKKEEKPPTLEDLWVAEHARREKFDAFMKMQKKLTAEEDKKKPQGWTVDTIAMLLLSITPINWLVLYFLLK